MKKNDLLESEEEGAGPDDEEQGQVEDSFLPGHHHPSVAAESVFTRQLLPFSHLPCDHYRRHGVLFTDARLLWINVNCYAANRFRQYPDGAGEDRHSCSHFSKHY